MENQNQMQAAKPNEVVAGCVKSGAADTDRAA